MRDFKKLLIWLQGMVIVDTVYDIIPFLPVEEKFGTRSQMTRSAMAIPACIDEEKMIVELFEMIKTEQKMLAKFIDKVGS
jgi:hypothetical protein